MAYQDPNYQTRREAMFPSVTGSASASVMRFAMFQKATLKKVHAVINTAGTNTTAAMDVYVGTASVGTIVLGTNAAGSVMSSGALNAAVAQGPTLIELKGIANSATVAFSPTFEYTLDHDGTVS